MNVIPVEAFNTAPLLPVPCRQRILTIADVKSPLHRFLTNVPFSAKAAIDKYKKAK